MNWYLTFSGTNMHLLYLMQFSRYLLSRSVPFKPWKGDLKFFALIVRGKENDFAIPFESPVSFPWKQG